MPVIDKDSVSRQVSIAVAVEIADGGQTPDVEKKRPTLDDAFLRDVYVYVQQRGGIGSPEGEQALKERLRQTAAHILEPVSGQGSRDRGVFRAEALTPAGGLPRWRISYMFRALFDRGRFPTKGLNE